MKTRQAAIKDILDSLRLDKAEESISVLTEVYRQRAEFDGTFVHFIDDGLSIPLEGYALFMEGVVGRADDEELRENYSLLTGVRHEWVRVAEESDCQPELVLKPLGESTL